MVLIPISVILMQHVWMASAPTHVLVILDILEMDLIAQVSFARMMCCLEFVSEDIFILCSLSLSLG